MLSYSECLKRYGSRYNIKKKVESGELFLIEKGIYSEQRYVPELAVLAYKYPRAVLTMRNAFYFHGLTDVIPEQYDFATGRDAAKISDSRIRQYFYPEETLMDGAETVDYKGYPILVYSKERMLIELIRYKSKLPYDYYKEIILNYRKLTSRLNTQKVQDYVLYMPKGELIFECLQAEVF